MCVCRVRQGMKDSKYKQSPASLGSTAAFSSVTLGLPGPSGSSTLPSGRGSEGIYLWVLSTLCLSWPQVLSLGVNSHTALSCVP